MQDITPLVSDEIKIIQSYGSGKFKVNEENFENGLFIFQDIASNFDEEKLDEIDVNKYQEYFDDIEILIIGYGQNSDFLSSSQEKILKQNNVKIEYMNSGAASRTYNILVTEERKVAALIIAV